MKQILTLLVLITSISFSQDFWVKALDNSEKSDCAFYTQSIANNSRGHLYTFCYYDCDSNGCKEGFKFSDDNGDTWLEKSIIDTNSVFFNFNLTISNHGDLFAWTRPPGTQKTRLPI